MTGPDLTPLAPMRAKRQRDLRLDFFRGLAMFIILLAHTPGNTWTLWIPARFGFSDATEIFVFCSGMASALAFGSIYLNAGWLLGTARIVFRCWQVYWAHIGVVLASIILLLGLDQTGLGTEGKVYANWPSIVRFFTHTQEYILGLFTLTFVPGLFDILPMYLAILAMVPLVMGLHKTAGRPAVFAFVGGLWLAAQLAGYARYGAKLEAPAAWEEWLLALSGPFAVLNLPSSPWNENSQWFFNPFGWQIVFFTGFAFGTGWLRPPPVTRRLLWIAGLYVLATIPFAWHKLHGGGGYLAGTELQAWISDIRGDIQPLRWKTGNGLLRYVHFLALAYLFWAAVGDGGVRLREGWRAGLRAVGQRRIRALIAMPVMILTAPYAYVDFIAETLPALNKWIVATWPLLDTERIGLPQLAHLAAVGVFFWNVCGDRVRQWLIRDGFLAIVPFIRKVGTQSLAVFMVSIVLSRFNGWWLDIIGRDVWTRLLVNGTGFAILIATAYIVGWFKRQPWQKVTAGGNPPHKNPENHEGSVNAP